MYRVTKRFFGGVLSGLTYTWIANYPFALGFTVIAPLGGSPYTIVACEKID